MPLTPEERPPDAEFEERRKKTIWQRLDELDQQDSGGHERHRKRIEQIEAQADEFAKQLTRLDTITKALTDGPVEAAKLRFSTQALYTIIGVTITIVISVIGSAASVRSDMRNINTRMDADSKLADQRYSEIKESLSRQEQQRREDKAAAEIRLKKYDNDELLRDLGLKGTKK